jgi:hypothetical protein
VPIRVASWWAPNAPLTPKRLPAARVASVTTTAVRAALCCSRYSGSSACAGAQPSPAGASRLEPTSAPKVVRCSRSHRRWRRCCVSSFRSRCSELCPRLPALKRRSPVSAQRLAHAIERHPPQRRAVKFRGLRRRPCRLAGIRAASLLLLALVVAACAAEEPAPTIPVPTVTEVEDCDIAHFTVTTAHGTEVSIGRAWTYANPDGIAVLDVGRNPLIESGSPRTLTLHFEYRGDKWTLTQRRKPSDILYAFWRFPTNALNHPADQMEMVSSCTQQRFVGVRWEPPFSEPADFRVAAIKVWGATAVHTTTGEASLESDDTEPLLKTVKFRPNLRERLLDSDLTKPLTASATVEGATRDSFEIRVTLNRQRMPRGPWWGMSETSGEFELMRDALHPYANARSEPVPDAPPLGSARHHRLLVFTDGSGFRVALGDGRVRDVDAVAFVSRVEESPGPTCSAVPGFPLRTFMLLTNHVDLELRAAREGKLIEQRRFAATPTCAQGMRGIVRSDPLPAVVTWLERWSGTRVVRWP